VQHFDDPPARSAGNLREIHEADYAKVAPLNGLLDYLTARAR